MPTSPETIAHLDDQLTGLPVRLAAMFGEYGIWFDGKPIGLICNDTLFLKRSDADPALLAGTYLAPPYPGAKDSNAVPDALADDADWLRAAVLATAEALPVPKPKKPRVPKR
ncbi:MAG: TfoX/Sxy family protein [Pseudolysinimonas sp.]